MVTKAEVIMAENAAGEVYRRLQEAVKVVDALELEYRTAFQDSRAKRQDYLEGLVSDLATPQGLPQPGSMDYIATGKRLPRG